MQQAQLGVLLEPEAEGRGEGVHVVVFGADVLGCADEEGLSWGFSIMAARGGGEGRRVGGDVGRDNPVMFERGRMVLGWHYNLRKAPAAKSPSHPEARRTPASKVGRRAGSGIGCPD